MINKTQINKTIAEYLNKKEQAKLIAEELEALRVELMSADGVETDKYLVSVSEFTQERVKGAKAILDASKEVYAKLVEANLIYDAPATRLNIKEISHRKAG